MRRNHVAALTADTMATLAVPREVKIPWLAERDKAVRWYRYQLEVQQDILDHMSQHGIGPLVLKGTHTAGYYPHPELREFGDLDLYFRERHAEADDVARKELGVEPDHGTHHHSKSDYRGVTVESHYDLLNTHYPHSNKRYDQMLKQLAPSADFEVLYLLRHAGIHFAATGITLRDLCDWVLTCRALHDKVNWTLVQGTIEEYGMGHFAALLGDIASQQLGYTLPLQFAHDASIADDVMRDTVYGSADEAGRLRQWRATRWKRRLVYGDSEASLLLYRIGSRLHKIFGAMHSK